MREPMRFDLQFNELRVCEDVEPLQAAIIGLVFKVEVSLPRLRSLEALGRPPVDEDFMQGLLNLDQFAAAPTFLLQEERMPAVHFSANVVKNGSQGFAIRPRLRFLGEHMSSHPPALNRLSEKDAGRVDHSLPKRFQLAHNRTNLFFPFCFLIWFQEYLRF
jgi:hypothetical protein